MKFNALLSVLRADRPLTRDTALVCSSANLTAPGLGTFVAGRRVTGALQLLLSVVGLALTTVCGGRFLLWAVANWTRLHHPQEDAGLSVLLEMWNAVRFALLGMFLFAASWAWAFLSSVIIMRRFPRVPPKQVPPRIM